MLNRKEYRVQWINDAEVAIDYKEIWTFEEIEQDFAGQLIVNVLKRLPKNQSAIWISDDQSTFLKFTRCY